MIVINMRPKQILTRKNQKKLTEEELKWIVEAVAPKNCMNTIYISEETMAYALMRFHHDEALAFHNQQKE